MPLTTWFRGLGWWSPGGYGLAMTRVLLALDGSELDVHIVETALRVFGDAEYLALNVRHVAIPPVPMYIGSTAPYVPVPGDGIDDADEIADVAHQVADDAAHTAGLDNAEAIGEIGNPAFTIPDVAEQHDVDVIVVGTHDRSWWSRLIEPSVAEGVIHQTSLPVMVVRTDHD
jgi:nucleotide-binding universal stress UspA family protein